MFDERERKWLPGKGAVGMWFLRKMVSRKLRRIWNKENSNTALALAVSLGAGAGLMYLLDPDRGRRRRASLRDAAARTIHQSSCAVGTTSRDVSNRARGLFARTTSVFRSDDADDDVIEARVRSRLGRLVSHPHAVKATVSRGHVTLTGHILAREADGLASCVSKVRGVRGVDDQLQAHDQPGSVPDLQGGRERPGDRFELMQSNWSPAARLLTTLTGGALMGVCARRRDALGFGLGTLGFGLMLRGVTNTEMKRMVGAGGGRRAIDIHKTININAPVERVFEFWTNYENFPHFMTNVREVREIGNGRSHWVVSGPAGVPVEWDAVITEYIPGKLIAWKSERNSIIRNAGLVRFEPQNDHLTRLTVRMSYNPPAGVVGHAVATAFGADPKHEMDADLARMKTMIETGNPPRDAARPLSEASRVAVTGGEAFAR
ncbi:MAG TPA: SRPBCC family protein [Blastocatellia bacterium]|nr:SRPBCC family protein [Blastocatellia bacterium]